VISVALTVDGHAASATVEPRTTLADLLRDHIGATSVHLGCEQGACGACTVLVDGELARSCLLLAAQCDGRAVTTLAGIGAPGSMHPLQEALRDSHGFQCGFCTPGFVLTALALLRDNPAPTEAEVRAELSGNLCRCTGYQSIVEGVLLAAERMAAE